MLIRRNLTISILRAAWQHISSTTCRRMVLYHGKLTGETKGGCRPTDIFVMNRDFNAPLVPPRPADSSAAMIAVNGLLLLADQEKSLNPPNITGSNYYTNQAIKVCHSVLNGLPLYPDNFCVRSCTTIQSLHGDLHGKVYLRMVQ